MTAPNEKPIHWEYRSGMLLLGLLTWRILYIAIAPFDLAPDEAYYWDWSRHLSWGYYSKPPMVAWVSALSTFLMGSHTFVVRLPAALLATLANLALFGLARKMFNARVGFWAVLLMAATPGSCVLGLIMTIDAPLMCFWMLALYGGWQAAEQGDKGLGWWIFTAFFTGLGFLSKQMMLVYFILIPLFLLLSREDRHLLKSPGPYLPIIVAILFISPVLIWNYQNDWITFQHTTHHFEPFDGSKLTFLITTGEFVGGQLVLISPLTLTLMAFLFLVLFKSFFKQNRKVKFLLIFSGFCLFFFVLMSLRQRINGNWPAVFYPTGFILLAAWGCGHISAGNWLNRHRKWMSYAVVLGAVFTMMTYGLPLVLSAAGLDGGKLDPTARLRGWSAMGAAVSKEKTALPESSRTLIIAQKRQWVSELAFYMPGQPRVYKWNGKTKFVDSQYELWPGPQGKTGWSALIVLETGKPLKSDLKALFKDVVHLRDGEISLGKAGSRKYSLYLGRGFSRWPY